MCVAEGAIIYLLSDSDRARNESYSEMCFQNYSEVGAYLPHLSIQTVSLPPFGQLLRVVGAAAVHAETVDHQCEINHPSKNRYTLLHM